MIDIVSPVQEIVSRIPQQFAPPVISQVPGFEAVGALAEITDGDATEFYRRLGELADDGRVIESNATQALYLTSLCAIDLWNIANDFIREASLKAPMLASPLVATQLALVGAQCVSRAYARVQRWEEQLAPLAAELEQRAGVPVEVHTNSYSYAELPPIVGTPSISEEPVETVGPVAPADSTEELDGGDNAVGEAAVAAAKSQLGAPYVWGGDQPGGFDCSGLTSWSYAQAGVEIPRTAENQAVGQQVAYEDLQAGDLVVWDGHVAMYAGDGQMIEAGSPVQMSTLRTTNRGMTFKGFWRPTA